MNDKFCETNQEVVNIEFKMVFTRFGEQGIEV